MFSKESEIKNKRLKLEFLKKQNNYFKNFCNLNISNANIDDNDNIVETNLRIKSNSSSNNNNLKKELKLNLKKQKEELDYNKQLLDSIKFKIKKQNEHLHYLENKRKDKDENNNKKEEIQEESNNLIFKVKFESEKIEKEKFNNFTEQNLLNSFNKKDSNNYNQLEIEELEEQLKKLKITNKKLELNFKKTEKINNLKIQVLKEEITDLNAKLLNDIAIKEGKDYYQKQDKECENDKLKNLNDDVFNVKLPKLTLKLENRENSKEEKKKKEIKNKAKQISENFNASFNNIKYFKDLNNSQETENEEIAELPGLFNKIKRKNEDFNNVNLSEIKDNEKSETLKLNRKFNRVKSAVSYKSNDIRYYKNFTFKNLENLLNLYYLMLKVIQTILLLID